MAWASQRLQYAVGAHGLQTSIEAPGGIWLLIAELTWNPGTLAITLGYANPIVGIVAAAWVHVEKTKSEHELKRRMIDQGMSADEIEEIISARRSSTPTSKS